MAWHSEAQQSAAQQSKAKQSKTKQNKCGVAALTQWPLLRTNADTRPSHRGGNGNSRPDIPPCFSTAALRRQQIIAQPRHARRRCVQIRQRGGPRLGAARVLGTPRGAPARNASAHVCQHASSALASASQVPVAAEAVAASGAQPQLREDLVEGLSERVEFSEVMSVSVGVGFTVGVGPGATEKQKRGTNVDSRRRSSAASPAAGRGGGDGSSITSATPTRALQVRRGAVEVRVAPC